jgi:hypothetical protein
MNMASNVNLKELWNRQTGPIPDSKEIFDKANKYKKRHLNILIRTNILLVLTSLFITWVVYAAQPQMISTKIGTVLVIIAMTIYLAVYNRMIPLLRKVNDDTSSHEYLQNLLKLNTKQKFLQTTMTNVYYILLSAGIFLYMIEYALRMKLVWGIVTYALTFAWLIFSWFYFRAKAIKKQERAINELIEKFEVLEKQLEE